MGTDLSVLKGFPATGALVSGKKKSGSKKKLKLEV
jgi:hypothetical protein